VVNLFCFIPTQCKCGQNWEGQNGAKIGRRMTDEKKNENLKKTNMGENLYKIGAYMY
jgi:hypothetical protein